MEGRARNLVVLTIVAVCVVLLVGVAAAFLLLAPAQVSTGGESGVVDRGFMLEPGAVALLEDGTRRATLHVRVSDGWTLDQFEIGDIELRRGGAIELLSLVAPPPTPLPSDDFDLVLELPAPAETSDDAPPERIRIAIRSRASRGLLGLTRVGSDQTLLFVVQPNRLVESGT